MLPLATQIEQYLHARGAALCGQRDAPAAITLLLCGPIYVASLRFAGSCVRRLVIKPMSSDARLRDPVMLMRVQQSLRARDVEMARQLVDVIDAEPAPRWIVMPWLAGRTLEALLHDALRDGAPGARVLAERAIRGVAKQCAALHRTRAAELGLMPASQCNKQYLPAMERVWRHRLMRGALGRGATWQRMFERVCHSGFAAGSGDRLVPVDVQPKNQMVDAAGNITFIDPDYVAGHPAITLATFLVGLDRLAVQHPSRRSALRIERFKRVFLRAYARAGEAWVLTALPAFYPWALVRVYEAHAQARPWARPYLAWAYGGALRRFVRPLVRRGRAWALPRAAATGPLSQAA